MKPSIIILLLLLLALAAIACGFSSSASGLTGSTSELPTASPYLLYQPGLLSSGVADPSFGLFFLDPTAETVTEWTPRGDGDLDIWAGTADDYQTVMQPTNEGQGRRILFVGNNGDFASYTVNPFNALSPDGRYHLESSRGEVSIRPVGAADSEIQILAQNGKGTVSWSPNSERILFPVNSNDGFQQMILHDIQTAQQVIVLETEADFRFHEWSPDGSAFAFTEHEGDETTLYQYTADGSTQLTADLVPFPSPFQMRFMPDGRSVLIASGPSSRPAEIYQFRNDGSGPVKIFEVEGGIGMLQSSPDGRWITFDVDRSQDDTFVEFTLLPTDGGAPIVHLVEAPVSQIIHTEFSPDGRKVALLIGLNNPRNGVDGLWLIDLDSADATPNLLVPQSGIPSSVWVERDGKLAYVGFAGVSNFVWSPDSESLYVAAGLEDSCETSSTISFKLVPSPDVEIDCRFAFYQVKVDGTAVTRLGEFETEAMPEMRSNLIWMPQ